MRVAFSFFLSAYLAMAQIQHGSVGVVHLTKDEISVAADSRGIRKRPNGNPDIKNDAICKVAAFGDDLVFVSTGTTIFLEKRGVPGWNNIDEARASYRDVVSRYSAVKGHIQDVATEFAGGIVKHFNELGARYPNEFHAAVSDVGNLTVAMFGGQAATGESCSLMLKSFQSPHRRLGLYRKEGGRLVHSTIFVRLDVPR